MTTKTAGRHTPWTTDAACFVRSFRMDNVSGITLLLNHRHIPMAAVSRAPHPTLAWVRRRDEYPN
jgi:predicted dithiol-disulfide oxidoreductase (DUF899 family)